MDLIKILSDEKECIDTKFGQRLYDNNETSMGIGSIRKDDQTAEVKNMGYYFNLDYCVYDFHHDIGTLTDFNDTELGYKFPASGDPIPCYGAIIPSDCFPAVEKISKMRFSIPVHIQFYEESDQNYAVRGEIILFFSDSLADARQVAESCGYDFSNWIGYIDQGFALLDVD
ncbi:MAG: hypothetical protein WCJ95_13490 [Mariniphaga sp.]